MPREHHLPATASLPSLARICPATHPLYYRTHNKILDGDGNAYYMNAETGESRWDLPVVPAEPDDLAAAGALVAGEAGMEADEDEDVEGVAESATEVGGEVSAATGAGAGTGAEAGCRDTGELQDAAMPPPPPAPTLSQEELDAKIELEEEMAAMRSMFAIQLAKNATTAAVATTMQRIEDEWRAAEKLRWEEIHKAAHADYRQNAAADNFRPPPGHPEYAAWLERTVAAEDTRQEALAALAAKGGSAGALAAGDVGLLPGPGLLDDMISAVTLEEDHASLDVPAVDELAMMIEGLDDSVASRPAARKGGRLDGPDAAPSETISLVSRKLSSAIARLSETEDAGQAPLRRVDLNSERIADEGAEQLAAALRTSAVRELFLLDNEIGDQGIVCIANALKSNRSLTELYLNGNGIGDEGVRSLCASFADSPLTLLNLSSNPISHRGAQFLAEMLVKPTCKVTLLAYARPPPSHCDVVSSLNAIPVRRQPRLTPPPAERALFERCP